MSLELSAQPDGISDEAQSRTKERRNGNISKATDNTDMASPRKMKSLSWTMVVVSLLSSMFLFSLDNTIVADIQPSIVGTFGQIEKLPWVSVGFPLGATAVTLFGSKLFDLFDNKILYISGVAIFEIGSVVCGAAPNLTALIFGRVICGVGATGIYVGTINILANLTTEAERPLYLSFIGLTWGTGTVLGPVIGGAFADGPATWRWSFYLNLCVGALVIPIYIFLIPSHVPCPGRPWKQRIRELDLLGGTLNAGAYATLIMAIAFGGGVYDWNSGQIIGLFICSVALWVAFVCQQALAFLATKENRILPIVLLGSYEMVLLFLLITLGMMIVYIPMYFIPLYFQFVKEDSALSAAVRLLPFIFLQVFGTVFNGICMAKFGYYMPWYLLGGIISLIGVSLLYSVQLQTDVSAIYGYSALTGLGSGLFVQASFAVSQGKVRKKDIALTTALMGCGQITGIVLALTVSNTIFLNQATARISLLLPQFPRRVVQNAISGTDSTIFRTLDSSSKTQVLNAITQSIKEVYLMAIAASALIIMLSLFLKREKLFGAGTETEADQVFKEARYDQKATSQEL